MDTEHLGKLFLVNQETGETIEWDGVKLIEESDEHDAALISTEGIDILREAFNSIAVAMSDAAESLFRKINEMAKEYKRGLKSSLDECLEDDKKPNPIYIPKHIAHRKKGRR